MDRERDERESVFDGNPNKNFFYIFNFGEGKGEVV